MGLNRVSPALIMSRGGGVLRDCHNSDVATVGWASDARILPNPTARAAEGAGAWDACGVRATPAGRSMGLVLVWMDATGRVAFVRTSASGNVL